MVTISLIEDMIYDDELSDKYVTVGFYAFIVGFVVMGISVVVFKFLPFAVLLGLISGLVVIYTAKGFFFWSEETMIKKLRTMTNLPITVKTVGMFEYDVTVGNVTERITKTSNLKKLLKRAGEK